MKKKIAWYFIILFISILFIIPSGTDNKDLVSGATEQFDIKDTFETQINNRLYTEYDNYTIGEHFRDNENNACDFENSSEGFVFEYGKFSTGSHSFINGTLIVEFKKLTGNTNAYYVLTTETNIDLLHYSIFEIKVKVNITTNDPSLYYKDENRINLVDTAVNKVFLDGTDYDIYTNKLDYKTVDEEEQITELMIICYMTGSSGDTTAIKYEIDFLNLFRNNRTDYATVELSDSYDFTEDIDDHNFAFATESIVSRKLKLSPDGAHDYFYFINSENVENYPIFELGFYSDFNVHVGNHYIYLRLYDTDGDYLQTVLNDFIDGKRYLLMVSADNYTSEGGTFEMNKYDDSRIQIKSTSGNWATTDYIYIDYVSYYNEDLKTTSTFKQQNTTSYRAYRGMNSFISNIPNNVTYYEGFTAKNTNSSIKIDVPSLEFFPEKIQFFIYMTAYFNFTLHIGDHSHILYKSTLFLNEWLFISKSIYRYNYLLNDTTDKIYFEITFDNVDIQNIFYIDELNIKYTEPPHAFTNSFNTGTGNYLDAFIYNTTNNYFHVTSSNEYLNSFSGDTKGIEYEAHSTNLYSRRMFLDYTVRCDEVGVFHQIIQEIRISLDKEYVLRTEFVNSPFSYTDFYNRLIWLNQYLYVDGILERHYFSGSYNDFIIDGFNDFDFSVKFSQEDYNTMSIMSIYNNKITGNTTSFEVFAFKVNSGEVKNSITKMNVSSYVNLIPAVVAFSFPDFFYHGSNPIITGKISREIKHSDIFNPNPDINIPVQPVWRGGIYALADIWNYCVYYVSIFIFFVVDFFRQSMFLRDIVKGITEFFTTFKDYWSNLVGYLSNFLTALGEIKSIGDFISLVVETIVEHLVNVFNTLVLIVADIIGTIGDLIDGEMLGFPILDDILDAWEAFVLRDWENFGTAFKNIVPEINEETIGFVLFIPDWFLSLWLDDVNFLSTLIINGLKISKEVFMWITILVIMYMVYFMQLVVKRDFDRVRIEVTTIVNVINWIIDGIVFVFHWIFELLHAVLDVTIPFT